jgi:nucleoid-associated protein YgaU
MDYSKSLTWKSMALVLAMITMSACSSSKVEEGENGETPAAETAEAPASTDEVPAVADTPTDAPADAAAPVVADGEKKDEAKVAEADPAMAPAVAENKDLAQEAVPQSVEPAKTEPAVADPVFAAEPAKPAAEPAKVVEPVAAEPVASASVEGGKSYKVKKGDTLMKIAFDQYGDLYRWKEIYEANRSRIQDPNHVPPGTVISLSGADGVVIERNGERYLIKHGDTLGIISNDVYGTKAKWKKLWENNRQLIKDPNKIYAGFSLYYVPEARLTHEKEEAPASAQNLPFKGKEETKTVAAASVPAPAANAGAAAPAAAPAAKPAADGARAPASAK